MIDIQIQGANEIENLLKQLERKECAKIVRKGVRDAQKSAILPDAKSNASSMVGGTTGSKIAAGLTVRAMTKMRRGHYGSKTIIKPDESLVHITKTKQRYYIPYAIEYGHAFPGRGGGKNAPKDVAPIPFMRKAYEQNKKQADEHLRMRVKILLEDAVRRLKK